MADGKNVESIQEESGNGQRASFTEPKCRPADVKSLAMIDEKHEALKNLKNDFPDYLIKFNLFDLDAHYERMQRQSTLSFRLAAAASAAAGILVFIGAVRLIQKGTIPIPSIIIGTGIFAAVFSLIIFHYYSRITSKIAEYGHKLLLVHNVCLALKMAEEVPQDPPDKNGTVFLKKDAVKELLQDVNKLLAAGASKGPSKL